MLKNNNGFFLAELLLSLSAFFMMVMILVPLFMRLTEHRFELEVHHDAIYILYEELISSQVENIPIVEKSVRRNNRDYTLNYRFINSEMEVCVRYELQSKQREACDFKY